MNPSYRTVFKFTAGGTEKSPSIPLILPSESIFSGNTAEKCPDDFLIFIRRSKLDLEPILPCVR